MKRASPATMTAVGFVLLACNQQQPVPKVADPPAFQLPTATEIFTLRSRCADLGRKILQENIIGSALAQQQTSHYNPKTNRCYVELDVFSADQAKPRTINDIFLFDGQTNEILLFAKDDNGVKIGFGATDLSGRPPYDLAIEAIADYMVDARQQ